MMVTDVSFGEYDDDALTVWTVPSEDYRPGMTEREAARLAVRWRYSTSGPGYRGIEGPTLLSEAEMDAWRPSQD